MSVAAENKALTCWVVSDGRAGIEIQCRGLAAALGFDPQVKRIRARWPWRHLPPRFWRDPLRRLDPAGDLLAPPWPDLLIGTGRLAVAPNLAIQIQDPKVPLGRFDIVVAPRHDRLEGPNVVTTLGSLHGLTEARLQEAAADYGPRLADLPHPRVAVMLGGKSRVHRMTRENARGLAAGLLAVTRDQGAGLLVTPSRRTDPETLAIIREALAGQAAEIWDGTGANPYLGFLALADAFVVTGDSVNMVCETAFTGKPVHIAEVSGGTPKFERFHAAMREAGITRPFAGHLESWSYAPLRETEQVAEEIRRRLGLRQGPRAAAEQGGSD